MAVALSTYRNSHSHSENPSATHRRLAYPRSAVLEYIPMKIERARSERRCEARRRIGKPVSNCAAYARCSGARSSRRSSTISTTRSKPSIPTSRASRRAIPTAANGRTGVGVTLCQREAPQTIGPALAPGQETSSLPHTTPTMGLRRFHKRDLGHRAHAPGSTKKSLRGSPEAW